MHSIQFINLIHDIVILFKVIRTRHNCTRHGYKVPGCAAIKFYSIAEWRHYEERRLLHLLHSLPSVWTRSGQAFRLFDQIMCNFCKIYIHYACRICLFFSTRKWTRELSAKSVKPMLQLAWSFKAKAVKQLTSHQKNFTSVSSPVHNKNTSCVVKTLHLHVLQF